VKKVDDIWQVVPLSGDYMSWWAIGPQLSIGRSAEILLDVELVYGQLCEGEYALVKDGFICGTLYHVLGRFSVVAEDYEVSVADTEIATRPIIYRVSQNITKNENQELITQRWLSIRTRDSAVTIYVLDDYEEFDTTGIVAAGDFWRNSGSVF